MVSLKIKNSISRALVISEKNRKKQPQDNFLFKVTLNMLVSPSIGRFVLTEKRLMLTNHCSLITIPLHMG